MLLVVAATQRELEGAGAAESLACGIGPVEAAASTARALADRLPDAVLHVGVAGARGIPTGTIVIGSAAIYEDARGPLVHQRVEPDPDLLAAARRALPDARVLPIGTSARVGGTSDCQVEGMEGFSVLRAAALTGVPALELRAVSNDIDEADRSRWRLDDALVALADAVRTLLPELL